MLNSLQLTMLSAEEKHEHRIMESGFNSEFWNKIEHLATNNHSALMHRAAFANSWDEHQKALGEMIAWATILNLKDALENEYVAIAEQRLQDNAQINEQTYE